MNITFEEGTDDESVAFVLGKLVGLDFDFHMNDGTTVTGSVYKGDIYLAGVEAIQVVAQEGASPTVLKVAEIEEAVYL